MDIAHKNLAQGRWQKLSLARQIGNIGAELARAKSWQEKNMSEQKNQSLKRALELIDLTLDSTQSQPCKREIARLREAVAGLFLDDESRRWASYENLEKFYLPFAILARR